MKSTDAILIHASLVLRGHKIPCQDVKDAIQQIVGIEPDLNGGAPETNAETDFEKQSAYNEDAKAKFLENLAKITCIICGSLLVKIRGAYPNGPNRTVCPCCLADRMDLIRQYADENYGTAVRDPQQDQPQNA